MAASHATFNDPKSPASSSDSTSTRTNADHRWQLFEKTTDRPSFINTFDNLPEGWVILAAEELAHRRPHYLPADKIQQQRLRQLPFYGWMEPETTFADGSAWPRPATTTSRLGHSQVLEAHHEDVACDVISQETLVDENNEVPPMDTAASIVARGQPDEQTKGPSKKRRGLFGKLRRFFAKVLGRDKKRDVPKTMHR